MNQPRTRGYNELAGTSLGRLAGISDGIFSVGMTLLVLQIAVPALSGNATDSDLWRELLGLRESALVYALSFMTLGIFWVGQGTQMSQLVRADRHYTWIHLGFLFAVTLVPFSTALLGHNSQLKLALIEYWLNIVLLGFMLLLGAEYAFRAHLFEEANAREVIYRIRGRVLVAQLLYLVAVALSRFFPAWVSIALIVVIQLNYVLAPPIPILKRF